MMVKKKSYIKIIFGNFAKFLLRILLFPLVLFFLFKKQQEKKKNKDKIAVFNMTQIDSLSGTDFENFLCELFEKLGYNVKTTKASHDYGADLLISKSGRLSIVQAKCYSKAVGIKAVQEIIGAKNHYGADEAIVATNNYFSKDAEVLAIENNVKLMDRSVIEKMLAKYDFNIEKKTRNFSALTEKSRNEINQRFHHMI